MDKEKVIRIIIKLKYTKQLENVGIWRKTNSISNNKIDNEDIDKIVINKETQ